MKDKNKEDIVLGRAIMLSVEVESNFKLYSYRIINRDQFVDRIVELVELLKQAQDEAQRSNFTTVENQ